MRFRTTLLLSGRIATGFVVPPEVVEPRARGIAPWRSPPVALAARQGVASAARRRVRKARSAALPASPIAAS